jgi:thiol:disulfide interchange protein
VYATAAWLLWVVAQETSPFGLGAALGGSILVALAAWSFQKSRSSAGGGRITVIATAVISLLLAIFLPIRFADVAAAASGVSTQAKPGVDEWQPYSAARVAELKAAGRPLLVNFTASWCLTCLVNERNAFSDAAVQEIFRDKKVTLMKGDWTNRDPAITKALAEFGRAGVPLYVVYNSKPGATEPLVLPQILTAGVVQSAFSDTPAK